ncbi:MAG: ORF6N domain-containing protein [bacterium]
MKKAAIPLAMDGAIEQSIYLIRGQKVMLDRDLAALYGVDTKALKQAVRRNPKRFPCDFMFVLHNKELAILRSQIVTSSSWGGERYLPMAFTEQGVAMLSSVLNRDRAIEVNIAIMRTFVKLRRMLEAHAAMAKKLAEMEEKYAGQFKVVFEVLNALMASPETERKRIGFAVRERRTPYRTRQRNRERTEGRA